MNDLNAVCAIFIPTVNQAECCGINPTIPVKKAYYWITKEVVSCE